MEDVAVGAGADVYGRRMTDAAPANPAPRGMTGSLAIIGVATLLRKQLDERLAGIGMSVRHLSVLGHVRARPGVSMTGLARRLGITSQSMHTTVHQLISNGLVVADGALTRGRSSSLRVTADGERKLAEALDLVAEIDERVALPGEVTDAIMHAAMRLVAPGDVG